MSRLAATRGALLVSSIAESRIRNVQACLLASLRALGGGTASGAMFSRTVPLLQGFGSGNRQRSGGGRPIMFPNTTGDGDLSPETRAAMRDDAIITSHILKCIPPNGAISVKSLNAQLPQEIQEAVSEKHGGLSSFLRERQQLFVVKPRPEDQVLFVAGNPIAIQKYASREVQKRTMRAMMGLDRGGGNNRQGHRGGRGGGRGGGGRGGGGYGNQNYSGQNSGAGRGGPPRGGGMASGRGSFGGGRR